MDYHVKRPKKEQKKMPKIQSFKFHYSFNNFGRDLPQEYPWILESKFGVFFQRRCRLKRLLPYGPMLAKMNKIWQKSRIWNFTILWTTMVARPSPRVYAWFWEWIWCVLSEYDMSFEVFLTYGPMLTKTKEKCNKLKNFKFWKTKKFSGDMVD